MDQTYISLLRGINVSGQNSIRMRELKALYEKMGFSQVYTYLQSGNLTFRYKTSSPCDLEGKITGAIRQAFGYEIPVLMLTAEKLGRIIKQNPLVSLPGINRSFLHVTFLATPPVTPYHQAIEQQKADGEAIAFSDEAVYLYCPHGYGKTRLTNNFLESRLKVMATTRNWNTVEQLMTLASN